MDIATHTQTPADDVTILIVDDEQGARETLVDICADWGYQADTAATGQQALEKIAGRFYNVAVLDVRLPDMSGPDLLAHIKKVHPDTECIVATGYASLHTATRALHEGAYAYITKPLDINDLESKLNGAMQRQRFKMERARLLKALDTLWEIAETALASGLEEALRQLLDRMVEFLHADAGAFMLLDERTGTQLEVTAATGLGEDVHHLRLPLDGGFPQRVRAATGPIQYGNGDLPEPAQDYFRSRGVRSSLCVPLRSRGQFVGLAHLDSYRDHHWSADDEQLFKALADRAAIMIDNARLLNRERLANEESNTLYQVSQALVERLELPARLDTIAHYLTRITETQRCIILLREGDRLVTRAAHGVPHHLREFMLTHSLEMDDLSEKFRRICDRGEPVVFHDGPADGLLPAEIRERFKIQSALLVPLLYEGQVIGVAGLDTPGEERQFSPDQIRLTRAVAFQAAVAIENARSYEIQRDYLTTLSRSNLGETPNLPDYDIYSLYETATVQAQIGGDYYYFIELPDNRLGVVVGDVCGKGITAAVHVGMARNVLLAYALEETSPGKALSRLNKVLVNRMSEDCNFITVFYGILNRNNGEFIYANGAHPHPLLYDAPTGRVIELSTTGGMVGALDFTTYSDEKVTFSPGSSLSIFTDGVTEARRGMDMLGTEGVMEEMTTHHAGTAADIAAAIYERARQRSDGHLRDDIAIVVIKAKETAAQPAADGRG